MHPTLERLGAGGCAPLLLEKLGVGGCPPLVLEKRGEEGVHPYLWKNWVQEDSKSWV